MKKFLSYLKYKISGIKDDFFNFTKEEPLGDKFVREKQERKLQRRKSIEEALKIGPKGLLVNRCFAEKLGDIKPFPDLEFSQETLKEKLVFQEKLHQYFVEHPVKKK